MIRPKSAILLYASFVDGFNLISIVFKDVPASEPFTLVIYELFISYSPIFTGVSDYIIILVFHVRMERARGGFNVSRLLPLVSTPSEYSYPAWLGISIVFTVAFTEFTSFTLRISSQRGYLLTHSVQKLLRLLMYL